MAVIHYLSLSLGLGGNFLFRFSVSVFMKISGYNFLLSKRLCRILVSASCRTREINWHVPSFPLFSERVYLFQADVVVFRGLEKVMSESTWDPVFFMGRFLTVDSVFEKQI